MNEVFRRERYRARAACLLGVAVLALGSVWAPSVVAANRVQCSGLRATIVVPRHDGRLVVTGTRGGDVIVGTSGTEIIDVRGGNDVVCAKGGDDRVDGGGGWDRLWGGQGHDRVLGGGDADDIEGDDGNDRLVGGDGDDRLCGGPGDDVVAGGDGNDSTPEGDPLDGCDPSGADLLLGNAGNDWLYESYWGQYVEDGHEMGRGPFDALGSDVARGGPGDDVLDMFDGDDPSGPETVSGGDGQDSCAASRLADVAPDCEEVIRYVTAGNSVGIETSATCFGREPTIVGTDGPDRIVELDEEADVIVGLGGDDYIAHASRADPPLEDWTCGGPGNDDIGDGAGDDHLSGGTGDDYISPGAGIDLVYGGPGNDRLRRLWWIGPDILYGGSGDDDLYSRSLYVTLFGGPGADRIFEDTCQGVEIFAGGGDDTILSYRYGIEGVSCSEEGFERRPDEIHGQGGDDTATVNEFDLLHRVEHVEYA